MIRDKGSRKEIRAVLDNVLYHPSSMNWRDQNDGQDELVIQWPPQREWMLVVDNGWELSGFEDYRSIDRSLLITQARYQNENVLVHLGPTDKRMRIIYCHY